MSDSTHSPEPAGRAPAIGPRPIEHPTLDAEELFAGGREVRVVYRGEEYRLQLTKNSKLILTK